ncbi:MAG: ribonuclease H family protein, partial [Candidatus Thiodiazotropha sp.]
KLAELGICGRMWAWFQSFLSGRSVACFVGEEKGLYHPSLTGLPQGSVLSPMLFNLFIKDMFKHVSADHCKYADDATFWHIGKDVTVLAKKVSEDVGRLQSWADRWRMKISYVKTEVTVFSARPLEFNKELFKLRDYVISYNPTPKILGITLDEKLNFQAHMANTERKAAKALAVIREVKGITRVSSQKLVHLYIALVRSIAEYGCIIWQTVSRQDLKGLEAVQRKALALCMGLPMTSSREALEVAAGVLPLDLHFSEVAIASMARIMAKSPYNHLKQKLDEVMLSDHCSQERFFTPIGLAVTQVNEMKRQTGLGIQFVQPEPAYTEKSRVRTIEKPSYWSQLGSSKTRNSEQQVKGKQLISKLVQEVPEDTVISFTDGSCVSNPGPCGAGAVIYYPNHSSPVTLKRPVSAHGSILLAELVAILAVVENLSSRQAPVSHVRMFCDSQSAVGILTLNWRSDNYQDVIKKIKEGFKQLEINGVEIELMWSPGHADIEGNELADELAKSAAKEAVSLSEETSVVTVQDVKKHARESVMNKWQDRWDIAESGRNFYEYKDKISYKRRPDFPSRTGYNQLMQLRTGYSVLNEYRWKIRQKETPYCSCGEVETVKHFMIECENYDDARLRLLHNLQTQLGITRLDLITL